MSIVRLLGGYVTVVAVVAVLGMGGTVSAADTKEKAEQKPAAAKEEKKSERYSYVAQPGDTYSQIVRKAVQTYGILNKKDIGEARIVAIETRAAEAAGWPVLAEGEAVKITEGDIKSWVETAMKLPEAEVAAWNTYVPYINFDTRAIGE